MWMRRLDYSRFFVLSAGTYTPFALLVLHGGLATAILIAVWAGALAGIVLNLVWVSAPKPVTAAAYITIGWVAVAAMPQLADAIGPLGGSLVLGGGRLYTIGAGIYAPRRPHPVSGGVGYHEVFHALVVGAAPARLTAIAV